MKRFYTTIEDNAACVWDGTTGACIASYPHYAEVGQPHPDSERQAADEAKRLNAAETA